MPALILLYALIRTMPYKLVQVKGGYYVENEKTGKRYSKRPIAKKNAEAQMRILMMYVKANER